MPGKAPVTPDKAPEVLLAAARLGAPRGVSGFLKLHSYSGEYTHLSNLKEALLAAPPETSGGAASGSRARTRLLLKVRAFEASGSGAQIAFEGYDSPETARELTGLELLVPRSKASRLRENEWYIADLVGLEVRVDGERAGVVRSVLEGGADPLLEVAVDSDAGEGGAPRSALVPFRKEFVGEVEIESGRLELLAPWLLE